MENLNNIKIKSRKLKKNYMFKNDDIDDDVLVLNNDKDKEQASGLNKKSSKFKKIRMSMTKAEEKKLDEGIQKDDNMSIGLIILILVLCFVVGISLGYLLYKIALNGGM